MSVETVRFGRRTEGRKDEGHRLEQWKNECKSRVNDMSKINMKCQINMIIYTVWYKITFRSKVVRLKTLPLSMNTLYLSMYILLTILFFIDAYTYITIRTCRPQTARLLFLDENAVPLRCTGTFRLLWRATYDFPRSSNRDTIVNNNYVSSK